MSDVPERIWAWPGRQLLWLKDISGGAQIAGYAPYILETEAALLASPAVQALIAAAKAEGMEKAEAQVKALREALEWYGEQARLCRLIHKEGDPGRHALSNDGGKRARATLTASDASNGREG